MIIFIGHALTCLAQIAAGDYDSLICHLQLLYLRDLLAQLLGDVHRGMPHKTQETWEDECYFMRNS